MSAESDFNARAKDWDANPIRVERAAAVAQTIRQKISLSKHIKALEYGCGTGLLSFALQPYLGMITLADSAPGMLSVLRDKIAHCGATNMKPVLLDLAVDPLPVDRFHLIYTLMTLHHIPQVNLVLQAFSNLLEPEGWLCIADLDQEDGSFHDATFTGHNGFERAALGARLTSLGFLEVRFDTAYLMRKIIAGLPHEYPVFLATCLKPG